MKKKRDELHKNKTGSQYTANVDKRTEESQLEDAEKYQNFLKNIHDGCFELDLAGNFTFFNDSACRILGYSREELMGMNYRHYTDKENAKKVSEVYLKVYNTGEPSKGFNWEVTRKDGSKRYIEASVSLQKDSSGKPTGFIGIVNDITERKQLESLLIDTEEKYRCLFETASDGIVLLEKREGKITNANPATEKLLGYTEKESIGNKLQDIGVVLDTNDFQTVMQTLNKSGIINYRNVKVETKSGQNIDTEIYLVDRAKSVQCNIRDITELKKTQETLRASEELFRHYLEYAPDGVYMSDVKGNFLYGNRKYEEITGYRREELIGKSFLALNLLSEKSLNKAAQLLQINMEGKPTGPDEIELISKEGRHIPVEISTSVVQRMGEEIVLAFVRDVTERKKVEKELQEREEQYRLVVENAKESIIIIQDMKVVFANRATIDTMGYSKEILASKSFTDLIHPDDLNMVIDHHIRRTKAPVYSFRIIGQDGTVIWCELNAVVIQWKGKPATLNFLNNITERKRVDEELKESEKKYRLLADNVDDVIFVLDMHLNFTYVSPSIKILVGYEPEELLKLQASEKMTPSSWDLAVRAISELMDLEKSEHREIINMSRTVQLEMRRKDGSTVWTEVKASFVRDENQRPVGIIGVSRDITERMKAAEELKQTLESLRKAVGATIQIMVSAVEMRDPYTAGHQLRAADIACAIAKEMGLPQDKIEELRMAGSIHDIGKLSIPSEILSKPTKLTNIEFSLIKEHSHSGYEMLKDVESPWSLAQIVYQHHERMDGSGYPQGLKGDEILMEARIMAVADVVESMASHRPYRAALGIEAALEEIEKNKGVLYDNTVADACLRLFREKGYQLT